MAHERKSILDSIWRGARRTEAAPKDVDFKGTWGNDLNSEMVLHVDSEGRVTGTYKTGVGQPDPTESFPLSGFVSGDLITFCVHFGPYGSLTAWAGQHTVEDGNEMINTLWHLATDVAEEDEPANLWRGILAGANTFTRIQ